MIPRQKLHDRGSIAPRSRFDRAAIAEFFHDTSAPSDEAQVNGRSRSPDRAAIAMKHRRQMEIKATVSPRGFNPRALA